MTAICAIKNRANEAITPTTAAVIAVDSCRKRQRRRDRQRTTSKRVVNPRRRTLSQHRRAGQIGSRCASRCGWHHACKTRSGRGEPCTSSSGGGCHTPGSRSHPSARRCRCTPCSSPGNRTRSASPGARSTSASSAKTSDGPASGRSHPCGRTLILGSVVGQPIGVARCRRTARFAGRFGVLPDAPEKEGFRRRQFVPRKPVAA